MNKFKIGDIIVPKINYKPFSESTKCTGYKIVAVAGNYYKVLDITYNICSHSSIYMMDCFFILDIKTNRKEKLQKIYKNEQI